MPAHLQPGYAGPENPRNALPQPGRTAERAGNRPQPGPVAVAGGPPFQRGNRRVDYGDPPETALEPGPPPARIHQPAYRRDCPQRRLSVELPLLAPVQKLLRVKPSNLPQPVKS